MSDFVSWDCFYVSGCVIPTCYIPVEFNASSRAMDQVVALGVIRNDEERETKKVLSAAALTYVAAAAVAVLELVKVNFSLHRNAK